MMDGEEGTTKYAEGAKREATLLFKEKTTRSSGAVLRCTQTINYLKATGKQLGLLVNFGHYPKLEHERFVHQALSRIPRIS
jgi:hypothetical protein